MIKYIIICLFFEIISCNFSHKQEMGSANNKSEFSKVSKDTVITYDIEGISLEGADAKVNYVNGKITKSVTSVYGETGRATIIYEFKMDKIKVLETKYSYKSGIENIKSDEVDMHLDYEISYLIDLKGNLIEKEIPDRIDIFKEFKEIVPFEL
jgi:hypothetical protein